MSDATKEVKGFGSSYLVVGVPAGGRLTTVHWGVNLAAQIYPLNTATDYCVPEGYESDEARDSIVQIAHEANARWIWMLDDDVLPPNIAVQRLMYAMIDQKTGRPYEDVIACAGIYYSKSDIPQPVVFEGRGTGPYWGWKRGEVFEVPPEGFIGTGCMLINPELIKKLERPWFRNIDGPDKSTDDAYFCDKAHAAGFKILGHGGVLCGHYDHKRKKIHWPPGAMFQEPQEIGA